MASNNGKAPCYPDGAPLGAAMNGIIYRNDVQYIKDPTEAARVAQGVKDGDTEAVIRALRAVGGYVRKLRNSFRDLPREDFDSAVATALTEAVEELDPDTVPSFAHIGRNLWRKGGKLMAEASSRSIDIPSRTLQRYYAIDKDARAEAAALDLEDHTFIALRIAGERHMAASTFLAVRDALAAVPLYSLLTDEQEEEGLTVEELMDSGELRYSPTCSESDSELVELAFAAVSEEEAKVVAVAYGFDGMFDECDNNARSDAEVAERVQMSRSKVQRIRNGALQKMRTALLYG